MHPVEGRQKRAKSPITKGSSTVHCTPQTEQFAARSYVLKHVKYRFVTITRNGFPSLPTHYLVLSQKDSRVSFQSTLIVAVSYMSTWWFHTIQANLSKDTLSFQLFLKLNYAWTATSKFSHQMVTENCLTNPSVVQRRILESQVIRASSTTALTAQLFPSSALHRLLPRWPRRIPS